MSYIAKQTNHNEFLISSTAATNGQSIGCNSRSGAVKITATTNGHVFTVKNNRVHLGSNILIRSAIMEDDGLISVNAVRNGEFDLAYFSATPVNNGTPYVFFEVLNPAL